MTLDNQTAYLNIGKEIPIVDGFSPATAVQAATPLVTRRQTGVIMQVTPRITPDGRVLMRVIPEVSSIGEQFPIGGGFFSPAINVQHFETTISALDGETVMLGGLILRTDNKNETKVPWLGDLPGIGAAFRYRTYTKNKSELIVIMTPHIVRDRADAERILRDESRRVDWVVSDVMHAHGAHNLSTILPHTAHGDTTSKMQPFRIQPTSGNPQADRQPQAQPAVNPVAPVAAPAEQRPQLFKGGLLKNVLSKRTTAEPARATPAPQPMPVVVSSVQYAPQHEAPPPSSPPAALPPLTGTPGLGAPQAPPPAVLSPVIIMPDRR
jgi:hypothetical protein